MFGFFNVRKPPGPTSHDMVDRVRSLLAGAGREAGSGERVKAGHAGTLDPFAEGVLVICVGPAVRLAEFVQGKPKRYLASFTLGATSDTDDPTGRITPVCDIAPTEASVREAIARFVGTLDQVPPAHSAVHVAGRRAYKLARKGQEVSLPARRVTIHSIDLLAYGWPALEIEVCCGGGTYIRALARDVGKALGVGGYCSRLVRTAVGPFKLDAALPVERLDLSRDLIPPLGALEHLPRVIVSPRDAADIAIGRAVRLPSRNAPGEVAVLNEQGGLIALATVGPDGRTARPDKVFRTR